MGNILYVVVPCYNEEEVLPETVSRLSKKMQTLEEQGRIAPESRIMLVNDGSKDRTWELICGFFDENSRVTGVNLSRNRGHQNALLAGLMTARKDADMVISMDADLQDDIDAMDRFIDEYEKGADVVYGVRSSRRTDSFFKRNSALMFYRLMRRMGVQLTYNHADYRLMSKRALDALSEYKEVNLFLRGMVPLIGFRSVTVEYERHERFAGESKYPLKKMLSFAVEGITSCTQKPLRLITSLGFCIFFLSALYLLYALIAFCCGNGPQGFGVLAGLICLFGGLQILCIGVIGEYIGKIYLETKGRPRYTIQEIKKQ